MRDLFEHKEAIFGELKRQSSNLVGATPSGSQRNRNRAPSTHVDTDESSRREKFEARAKAISEARRDRSPAPTNRHRRDKSTDGSAPGRFPVVASPRPDRSSGHDRTVSGVGVGPMKRASLEVPGSETSSPQSTRLNTTHLETPTESPAQTTTNGPGESKGLPSPDFHMSAFGGPGPHIPPPREGESPVSDEEPAHSGTTRGRAMGAGTGYTAYNSQTQGPIPTQSSSHSQPQSQSQLPQQNQDQSTETRSQTGSLKRTAVKSRSSNSNSNNNGNGHSNSGNLRGRGENTENESVRGVQLEDRPMDDFA